MLEQWGRNFLTPGAGGGVPASAAPSWRDTPAC
jgi:hypothetical protein